MSIYASPRGLDVALGLPLREVDGAVHHASSGLVERIGSFSCTILNENMVCGIPGMMATSSILKISFAQLNTNSVAQRTPHLLAVTTHQVFLPRPQESFLDQAPCVTGAMYERRVVPENYLGSRDDSEKPTLRTWGSGKRTTRRPPPRESGPPCPNRLLHYPHGARPAPRHGLVAPRALSPHHHPIRRRHIAAATTRDRNRHFRHRCWVLTTTAVVVPELLLRGW